MKRREMAELVAMHPFFSGLPPGVLELASGCARMVAVAPGRLLLAEGEPADDFYLLRRGRVAIEVHSAERGPLVLETVGPGHVVGWSWMIPPYRWQFDARALEPVGAIGLDARCLRDKADREPAFGYALSQRVSEILVERLQAARIRLLDLYGDARGS